MQHRSLALILIVSTVLTGGSALAADPAKPAAPAATPQSSAPAPASSTTKSSTTPAAKPAKKPKPLDLNSASAEQLKSVPGVDDARAEKIVKNRPYPTRAYLVTKGVYSQEEYYTVKDYFVATPPAKAKK
jgi:DNA uptake protein ComE-like DNA-binding protein